MCLLPVCAKQGLLPPTGHENHAQETRAVPLHRCLEPANHTIAFWPGLWSNLSPPLLAITPTLWSGLTHTGPAAALHSQLGHPLGSFLLPGPPCASSYTLTHSCFRPPGPLGTAPHTHTYTCWSVKAPLGPPDTRKPLTGALRMLCSLRNFRVCHVFRNSAFQGSL